MENPKVLCLSGRLAATKARKGSIATLKDASIIITICAPTHNAGITPAKEPEFGKNTKAADESNASVKK